MACPLADWTGSECGRCDDTSEEVRSQCRLCRGSGRIPGVGGRVVAAHPVTAVEVTDRAAEYAGEVGTASVSREVWLWYRDDDHHPGRQVHLLPHEVFDLLPGGEEVSPAPGQKAYPSLETALVALSAALIAWALTQPAPTT